MPLPSSGPLSASQVATEFGLSSTDQSFTTLGSYVGIIEGSSVTLPDSFYGAASTTPTVQTNAASSVTSTGMTLNGNVTAAGSTAVTARGFWFGTNSTYNGAGNTQITIGSGTGTFSSARTGLTAGTTYYIFAFATNSQGTTIGSSQTQATSGGGSTAGSVYRAGTTSQMSIANRIIQRTSQEPTTDLRLTYSSTFTVNFWMKVGWTSALSSQGTYQHLWGTAANAIQSPYVSNVYNQNIRFFYREDTNRLYFGFLGTNIKYSQNFWFMHNSGQMQTATGLGTTYWSNTNRGNVNSNGYCMISITFNQSMSASNCKLYWNGVYCGDSYYSGGQINGTPTFNTDDARLTTLLGSPYSQNSTTYGGTGDLTAGYLGGNGNTYIDEYSLWDSVLSTTDLLALYNEGDGGSISTTEQPEGLIVYYNFDSTSQDGNPVLSRIIWPDPGTNSGLGKMEVSGSSGFGSGTNTING